MKPEPLHCPTLLLRSSSLISLALGPLLPGTDETRITSCSTECLVGVLGTLGHITLLDRADSVLQSRVDDGKDGVCEVADGVGVLVGGSNILLGRIGLLVLSGTAGEDDKALLVSLQALDIDGESIGGEVGTARVDRDTDGGSVLARNASFL